MNKQPNSSKILDILLRNMLSEQIKWRKHALVGVLIFFLLLAIYVGYQ
jgi:hypothetical protein